jgi:hypothetical protein
MQAVSMRCQGSVLSAIAFLTRSSSSTPTFLPDRPQKLFFRYEIIVDRGRLHFRGGGDIAHRCSVETLLIEERLSLGNDARLGLRALGKRYLLGAFGLFALRHSRDRHLDEFLRRGLDSPTIIR